MSLISSPYYVRYPSQTTLYTIVRFLLGVIYHYIRRGAAVPDTTLYNEIPIFPPYPAGVHKK